MSLGPRVVFITGGTGFMGRRLVEALRPGGHDLRALVRPSSQAKLPSGVRAIVGDPLDAASYAAHVAPADTFVHLVGVAHPNPAKAQQFLDVDLRSLEAAVQAAHAGSCTHFVFVSVAQPAPVMQAYVAARAKCERVIGASGINATILRPW